MLHVVISGTSEMKYFTKWFCLPATGNAGTWLWVPFLQRGGGIGIRFSLGLGPSSLLGPHLLSASRSPSRLRSHLPESTASVTCLDSADIRVCDRLLQPWESSTHSVFVLAFLCRWLTSWSLWNVQVIFMAHLHVLCFKDYSKGLWEHIFFLFTNSLPLTYKFLV